MQALTQEKVVARVRRLTTYIGHMTACIHSHPFLTDDKRDAYMHRVIRATKLRDRLDATMHATTNALIVARIRRLTRYIGDMRECMNPAILNSFDHSWVYDCRRRLMRAIKLRDGLASMLGITQW